MEAGSPRKHFHPASKLHSILWPISLLGKNRSGTAAKLPSTKAPTEVEKPKEREAEQAAADFPLTFLQSSLPNTFYGRSPTWTCERNPEQSSGLRQRRCCNLGPCVRASFGFMQVCSRPACPDARHHRLLLTAAVGVDVLLQRRYVSVPAQGVNLLRVWRLAEENKGFAVGLGGAEPSQVAARGEVVIQGRRQRGLLAYLKQEAKLKGCRNKSLHRITSGSRLPSLGELGSSGLNRALTKDHSKYHPKNKVRSFRIHKGTWPYFDFGQ